MPPKKAFVPQKRACDICYEKKTVCSLPVPQGPCERCVYRNLECTFDREKPSKKRRTRSSFGDESSDTQALSQRVKQLENALTLGPSDAQPSSETQGSATHQETGASASSNKSRGSARRPERSSSASFTPRISTGRRNGNTPSDNERTKFSVHQLGPNWFFNGMPIFSEAGRQWISTRTDQDIAWDDLCIPTIDFPYSEVLQVVDCDELFVPSEKSACLLVMKFYFESFFRLAYPVLDQLLFDSTVQAAFEGESTSPRTVEARACVLAALSIAGRRVAFETKDTDIGDEKSDEKYHDEAHQITAHLLLLDISEEISLDALQATIILQLLHMFKGRWRAAAYYNSSACRMVCSLGGHIYEPEILENESSLAKREKNHTRTLFWLCYMLDKDVSLRTGNPPLLTETYSDLTTPMHFLQYYNHLPTAEKFIEHRTEKNISLAPHFLGESQLSYLKEKVCRRLFSAPALKNNDDQLLLHIRELDDEIESWRLSIPTAFRPALSVSQKNLSDLSEITDPEESDPEENEPSRCMPYIVRRMSLQLEYHHLMTIIHTAVRKCKPDATNATEDLHDVVHSSFDLALVASKSTLSCLKFLVDTIKEESYPFFPYYLTTAAMTIFLDIVIHPLGSQAQLNLEHLVSASNTIDQFPWNRLMLLEEARMREDKKFLMRLVWLGTCAITKADRERDLTECVPSRNSPRNPLYFSSSANQRRMEAVDSNEI